jgi:cell division protein FtsI/penicillin-binding protein 2
MRSSFTLRIYIILGAVVLFALILFARLYFIQIVHGDEFSQKADRQYVRPAYNLYDRGSVFFSDKEGNLISAATLRSGFLVAVVPDKVVDKEEAFELLSEYLELDRDDFLKRVSKEDDPYEEIAHEVDDKIAKQIEALKIPGINIYRERWRYYPGETLAAHAVGFVGFQGDELTGRYGLERYYNHVLSRAENSLYVNFFAELFANIGAAVFHGGGNRSGDVVTSIEPSVQLFLERKLREVNSAWNAKQTAGIVINPRTGSIYALGVYPTFSPNTFNTEANEAVFVNPLVESVFEMGSIIKPLTVAAGLDAGAITPETTYVDHGKITLDGKTISNFDGEARGRVAVQEILNQSLNTGAAFVVDQMGTNRFREYMYKYRIGEETGIDLPNESAGLISNLETPRRLEYATASFGQGIAITPIAMVRALSVLANGGVLVTPHVGRKIQYETGLSKEVSFSDGERVLKAETAEEITRMLVAVVDEALANGEVSLPNYSVAAKTGTAQIAEVGGYSPDRFLHSFFGYFPAYDAEFLIFLYTLEPKGVRYASQTLTDPFMDTVEFLINYYAVPPDR